MTRLTSDAGRHAGTGERAQVIVEADGTISWANHAATQLLDVGREQLVGRPLREILAGSAGRPCTAVRSRHTRAGRHGAGFDVVLLGDLSDRPRR